MGGSVASEDQGHHVGVAVGVIETGSWQELLCPASCLWSECRFS